MLEKMKMIWQDAKQLKDERGLTLVELLVVVVILGIIAAIAVVAIGGIIENSKKDAMVADAKQMVSAAKLYTASNPVTSDTVLNFNSAADGEVPMDSYIDKLKDPFDTNAGETATPSYPTAKVTVKPGTSGKYTYEVTLTSDKSEYALSNADSSSITKDSL
ncbi:prepilin-type N-terminal cleavage/methylation domain-containing protein [Exiguobacterium sp. s50]|uniref:prepilin-type N-terminal cleavage/methylation domain-containing protein n=1 Tax=Exiguobacterium sp. s50 TaxID=2751234 RepID=UPI001BE658C3|nr:prepilin-type N-terminal cleavage/methylation domain-containing protein [Exiguobacterium sp. s50]